MRFWLWRHSRQNTQRFRVFGERDDRQIGNLSQLSSYTGNITAKRPAAVIVVRGHIGMRLAPVALPGEGKLRVPPQKFPVVQLGVQGDLLAGIFWDAQAVVNRICRPGRNQPHIDHRARGPGVALVDHVAVRIHLQRAVEVCAGFHRAVPAILNAILAVIQNGAAPE